MAGINGNFADGFNRAGGWDKVKEAIFGDAYQNAKLQGGLLGAQTAKFATDAAEGQRLSGLRGDRNFLRTLDAVYGDGAGAAFQAGGSADKLSGNALEMQKYRFNDRSLADIEAGIADQARLNQGTALLAGKTYEPFAAVGDTGLALNKGTGGMVTGNQALLGAATRKAAADGNKPTWDSTRGVYVFPDGTAVAPTLPGGAPLPTRIDPAARPMPSTVLRMQQENLDSIGLAGAISADLNGLIGQFENGELDVGPFQNALNEGLNATGFSTEGSRNYASLRSTLEKIRNDSLRLNKGVQTEGDAVRAWNEMFKSLNDPQVVMQRLREISAINKRAAELHTRQNDLLRAQFGHDPMDYTPFMSPGAVLGGGQAAGDGGSGIDALLEKYR
ncbi:MAG: hypothetical protein WBF84_06730 [Castellaniella sp.]|uniref:hypothetical protein n=1 Tax=Castellaniella sp. TaxID=1955812 RepID=UPI003C7088C9